MIVAPDMCRVKLSGLGSELVLSELEVALMHPFLLLLLEPLWSIAVLSLDFVGCLKGASTWLPIEGSAPGTVAWCTLLSPPPISKIPAGYCSWLPWACEEQQLGQAQTKVPSRTLHYQYHTQQLVGNKRNDPKGCTQAALAQSDEQIIHRWRWGGIGTTKPDAEGLGSKDSRAWLHDEPARTERQWCRRCGVWDWTF